MTWRGTLEIYTPFVYLHKNAWCKWSTLPNIPAQPLLKLTKNANIIMIENAERFGLSQLHQLRGRVGRGSEKSYCILLSDSKSGDTVSRLDTMKRTSNGFEIADQDLKLRGPGDFFGKKQHGLPEMKIADFSKTEDVSETLDCVEEILKKSPNLSGEEYAGIRAEINRLFVNSGGDSLN